MKNFRLISSQDNLSNFASVLFLFCMLLIFNACKKETFTTVATDDLYLSATTDDDREILDGLTKAGFSAEDISFQDDFVDYQEDAGWDKAALLNTLRSPTGIEKPIGNIPIASTDGANTDFRQQGILQSSFIDAVKANKVAALQYFIRSSVASDCGSEWEDAILKGVAMWNDEPYCRVKLTQIFEQSKANIVFGSDADPAMPASHINLPETTVAKAGFPSAGTPWKWISINKSQDEFDSKLKTIMHALGHCIGYLHTDSSEGDLISNTPVFDLNSIMNQGVNTTPVFSTGDSKAIRLYYPDFLAKPINLNAIKLSETEAKVKFENVDFDKRPYYWTKCVLYSNTGVLISSYFIVAEMGSDVTKEIKWSNLTPGVAYKFSVQGFNFRRDIASPESVKVTVQM
jgi:hypothetical protein